MGHWHWVNWPNDIGDSDGTCGSDGSFMPKRRDKVSTPPPRLLLTARSLVRWLACCLSLSLQKHANEQASKSVLRPVSERVWRDEEKLVRSCGLMNANDASTVTDQSRRCLHTHQDHGESFTRLCYITALGQWISVWSANSYYVELMLMVLIIQTEAL